jgi:uncharacterized protein YgfB (UPF0149 family)
MPMSEAAIQGSRVNGHRWKHELSLRGQSEIMGKMNSATSDDDVAKCANAIVGYVRAFIARLPADQKALADEITHDADTLEEMADCGLDEVRNAMVFLYDTLDYNRVCVVG